jgi:heptosyltransferase-2
MKRFLVIQTAFIGDVILATALIEQLHNHFPEAKIDVLVRKGNEGLLQQHPFIHEVVIWNKKQNKLRNLFKLIRTIRSSNYDEVINLQRFLATGLLSAFSGGKVISGFKKNPLSFLFTHKVAHQIGNGKHEVERNLKLIEHLCEPAFSAPRLYPSTNDYEKVKAHQSLPYVCMAPASVWFTKQLPEEKWTKLIDKINTDYSIYLIGAPGDLALCERIKTNSKHPNVKILAGQLSFLESAALMEKAKMNYVNDSAPLHIASAMNAPTTAFFCSTLPEFGFGPLTENATVLETQLKLNCRPCGLHGKKACPENHFNCAHSIELPASP